MGKDSKNGNNNENPHRSQDKRQKTNFLIKSIHIVPLLSI